MLGEGLHIVVAGGLTIKEFCHVGGQRILFIIPVAANLMGISVIEFHDELSQRIVFVERLHQLPANTSGNERVVQIMKWPVLKTR